MFTNHSFSQNKLVSGLGVWSFSELGSLASLPLCLQRNRADISLHHSLVAYISHLSSFRWNLLNPDLGPRNTLDPSKQENQVLNSRITTAWSFSDLSYSCLSFNGNVAHATATTTKHLVDGHLNGSFCSTDTLSRSPVVIPGTQTPSETPNVYLPNSSTIQGSQISIYAISYTRVP